MTRLRSSIQRHGARAFSLVEVVLALAIVSFGLLSVIGVYASLVDQSQSGQTRRAILDSVNAISGHLASDVGFEETYNRLAGSSATDRELAFVSYRIDSTGNIDADGTSVTGKWMFDWASLKSELQNAREGLWIKARISLSSSVHPPGILSSSDLPADPDDYPFSYLGINVDYAALADPDLNFPAKPDLSTTIILRR